MPVEQRDAAARRTSPHVASHRRRPRAGGVTVATVTALLAAVNLAGCTGSTTTASTTPAASSASAAASTADTASAAGSSASAAESAASAASSAGSASASAGPVAPSGTSTANRCAVAVPYDNDFVTAVNDYVGGVANTTTTMAQLGKITAGLSEAMKGADFTNLSPEDKAITSLGLQIGIYQRSLGQSEQKQGQALSAALVSHVAVQQACDQPRGRGCDAALAMSYAGVLAVQTVTADAIADFQQTITNASLLAESAAGLESGARETAIQRTAAALSAVKGAAQKGDQTGLQTALKGLQQARTGLEQACGATSAPSPEAS